MKLVQKEGFGLLGLTRQEYNKKYREEHREYFINKRKEYQNKKKAV